MKTPTECQKSPLQEWQHIKEIIQDNDYIQEVAKEDLSEDDISGYDLLINAHFQERQD